MTAKHRAHDSTLQKPNSRSRCVLCTAPRKEHRPICCDHVGCATVEEVPDEVLLHIFNFCMREVDNEEEWETLVHVCRRWRFIVYGAPRRLDLRLVCTAGTPARKMLDIWPVLPIFIRVFGLDASEGIDNIVAALEHNDRVREIYVEDASNSALETLAAAMQDPFGELMHLDLCSLEETAPVLPDSFLGGTAPRLRSLSLRSIPFPALPKFLLSSTDLVSLGLWDIPNSGYISPEVMVTCLSALTGLADLYIQFRSPRPRPDQESEHSPPPATRAVLPVLTSLAFQGASEYLDHFFAHIEAPMLKYVDMRFFNPAIFEVSQITPFVGCTEPFKALNQAHMLFYRDFIDITLSSRAWSVATGGGRLGGGKTLQSVLLIKCKESRWQLWSLTQACRPSFAPGSPSELEYFDVREPEDFSDADSDSDSNSGRYSPPWADEMENAKWLELLHFFPIVEHLYLSEEIALRVARALQEVFAERLPTVLPALQNLFIERLQPTGPIQEVIGKFVVAKQLSGHPIAVRCWVRENRCQ